MIFELISSIGASFTYVFEWFVRFYDSMEAYELIISLVIIYLTFRFLLTPFFGSSGSSDRVKKKNNKEEG